MNERKKRRKKKIVVPDRIPGQQIHAAFLLSTFFLPKTAYELLVISLLTLSFIRVCFGLK